MWKSKDPVQRTAPWRSSHRRDTPEALQPGTAGRGHAAAPTNTTCDRAAQPELPAASCLRTKQVGLEVDCKQQPIMDAA